MATARQLIQSGVGKRSRIKASHLLNRGESKKRVAADFDIVALDKYMASFHPAGTKQVGGRAKDRKAIKRSFRETKSRVSRNDRVLPHEYGLIDFSKDHASPHINSYIIWCKENGDVVSNAEGIESLFTIFTIKYKTNIKHRKPFRA